MITLPQQLSRQHIKHMLSQLSPDELVNHVHTLERQRLELQQRNKSLQEAELKYSVLLEHYRLLYQHAPIGYVTIDYSGLIMKANQTLATLLGYPLTDLLRESLPSLMPHAEAQLFSSQLAQLCKVGQGRYDTKMITKDNGLIDIRFEGRAFEMGETIQLHIVDISEIKALQQQYKTHAVVMHEAECAMTLVNEEGVITNANRRFCQKSMRQQQELQGVHVSKLFSLEHGANFFTEITTHLKHNKQWSGQVLYQAQQHAARQYKCIVSIIRHDATKNVNYIIMFDC